jgi:hypothetical protein
MLLPLPQYIRQIRIVSSALSFGHENQQEAERKREEKTLEKILVMKI